MQPDVSVGISLLQKWRDSAAPQWQQPLLVLVGSVLLSMVLTGREWAEMFHQWWNIDTYSHILLVPLIIAWLVYLKIDDLKAEAPQGWLPGLALLAVALGLWVVGRLTGINLLAHAGAVGAVQAIAVTVLGLRVSTLLMLPIGFVAFLVPFGDEIIPQLQMITASIAIALTEYSGVPAEIDGIYIDTPVGLFIVAEACSGVKFLIAMITLAVLVAFTRFTSWPRRLLFMAIAIIVPIIANGIRAWGTIYIAQFQGVEFAAGFDHIFYGWIFFAIVVTIVLASAWKFFEQEPEDHGYRPADLDSIGWLNRIPAVSGSRALIAGASSAMILVAGLVTLIVPFQTMG